MKYCMKSLQKNKIAHTYCIAIALLILSLLLGVLLGSTKLNFADMLSAIANGNMEKPEARIMIYVRLPRVLASIICGMALAVSGAVIQSVLTNKLASPSIIGVNAGAGLAVTLSSAFGVVGGWRLSLFSFIGAFITVMIVSLGAKKWGASRGTVILLGVALNAFLGAISDTVTTFVPEISVQSFDFKIGDFSSATYAKVFPGAIVIIVSVLVLQTLTNELDVLTLGEADDIFAALRSSGRRGSKCLRTSFLCRLTRAARRKKNSYVRIKASDSLMRTFRCRIRYPLRHPFKSDICAV